MAKLRTHYVFGVQGHNVVNAKRIQSAIETTAQAVGATHLFRWRMTQTENIRASQGTAGGQKWFSYLFYGRTDFYDLPNAW
jgi:hypothetical protein